MGEWVSIASNVGGCEYGEWVSIASNVGGCGWVSGLVLRVMLEDASRASGLVGE